MTNDERKQLINELLAKGLTLSQIQDHLHKEKNDPITYMDLRLLLSEMPDAKLPEKETPKTVLPTAAARPARSESRAQGFGVADNVRGTSRGRSAFDQHRSDARARLHAERVRTVFVRRESALVPR